MIRTASVLLAITALFRPQFPHPLDDVLGNRKLSADQARRLILESEEFRVVVKKAVQMASWHANQDGLPNYAQCVRRSIANQLSGENAADPPLFAPAGHHPIEKAIEREANAASILKAFSRSPAFAKLVEQAVSQAEPLAPHDAGFTFGQGVRVYIGVALMEVDPEPDANKDAVPAPSAK